MEEKGLCGCGGGGGCGDGCGGGDGCGSRGVSVYLCKKAIPLAWKKGLWCLNN